MNPTECYDPVTHVHYAEHEESVHNPGKCARCGEPMPPEKSDEKEADDE